MFIVSVMIRPRWLIAVFLSLVVAGFLAARAQDSANALPSSVKSLHEDGLLNFYQVAGNIYSGSVPQGESGFKSLQALGIKTIINVDGAKPDLEAARKYGLHYVDLPFGYNGVPNETALRLVKAVETLPGPFYIHCHHGIDRGPSAAAVVCIATVGWTPDQAIAWLRQAGTDTNYPGLYRSVRAFRPPTAESLSGVTNNFPEVADVSPLADAMVELNNLLDDVKLTKQAGYETPLSHPDLDTTNAALALHEALKDLVRSPLVEDRPQDFRNKLTTTEEAANKYHLSFLITPFDTNRADLWYQRTVEGCAACHAAYRN